MKSAEEDGKCCLVGTKGSLLNCEWGWKEKRGDRRYTMLHICILKYSFTYFHFLTGDNGFSTSFIADLYWIYHTSLQVRHIHLHFLCLQVLHSFMALGHQTWKEWFRVELPSQDISKLLLRIPWFVTAEGSVAVPGRVGTEKATCHF